MQKWRKCICMASLAVMKSKPDVFITKDIPIVLSFSNIHRLVETGSVRKGTSEGRPLNVRTPEIEEALLHEVKEHPETSTRNIARNLNICHQTVWRILVDFFIISVPYFKSIDITSQRFSKACNLFSVVSS